MAGSCGTCNNTVTSWLGAVVRVVRHSYVMAGNCGTCNNTVSSWLEAGLRVITQLYHGCELCSMSQSEVFPLNRKMKPPVFLHCNTICDFIEIITKQ